MTTVAGQKPLLSDGGVGNGISDTEGQTTSYADSKSHVANTYEYARLV